MGKYLIVLKQFFSLLRSSTVKSANKHDYFEWWKNNVYEYNWHNVEERGKTEQKKTRKTVNRVKQVEKAYMALNAKQSTLIHIHVCLTLNSSNKQQLLVFVPVCVLFFSRACRVILWFFMGIARPKSLWYAHMFAIYSSYLTIYFVIHRNFYAWRIFFSLFCFSFLNAAVLIYLC